MFCSLEWTSDGNRQTHRRTTLPSVAICRICSSPARAWEYVFTGVGLCVCLSVTTITKKIVDGFIPNFMGRFLWGKGRPCSCFVTIGSLHFILLIVGVASVAKCWRQKPQISLSRGVVLSQGTFRSYCCDAV